MGTKHLGKEGLSVQKSLSVALEQRKKLPLFIQNFLHLFSVHSDLKGNSSRKTENIKYRNEIMHGV